jgi:hypothetical protein
MFCSMSSPAEAGDPVFQRRSCLSRDASGYWMPAFAGMTSNDWLFRAVLDNPLRLIDGFSEADIDIVSRWLKAVQTKFPKGDDE